MSTILPIRASWKKPWKRIPFSHWISVLLISAFTFTLCLRSDTLAGPVDAVWTSGTGVWSDPTKWDIGSVPTNGAESTYNIFIDKGVSASSVVSLDIDATISNLSISSGDALSVSLGKTLNIAGGAGAGTLINDGTFTLRGSSDPSTGSTLTILGTSTLQGTGSMTLEEHSAILRDTSTTSSSSFLINASGHTIQGAGYIGGVPSAVNGGPGLTFTNHEGGVVRANVSGKSLVLSTITASYNAGTMEATGGGILLLTGSGAENRYYNAAPGINGVIQAKDGSRVELAGVYIEGGIFTTEGSGVIRTVNTGTREGASLRGITNRGAFETGLGTTNFLNSTLINDGTFTLRGSSDPSTGSTLTILGTSTLQGTGSMTLEEHSAILRDTSTTSSSSFLINASGHTIQGAGYIGGVPSAVNGGPGLTFTNHEGGVVRANVSGKSLVLSTITASYNAGTMEATGGGILLLTGSGAENRYYNAAPGINGVIQGVIRAKDGSRVELAGVYIEGGIFTTEGSGVIRTVNTGTREGASLRGITNRGAFETGLGTTNFLNSTLINDGTFTLRGSSDPSTGSTLTILGTSTLQGTGSMTLEEHSAILRDTSTTSSSSFLINASGHTIQGAGYIGGVPSAVNGGPGLTFTNHEGGVVRANVSGKSLVLSTITASYNAGTMEATGGGILLLTGSGAENRYYNAAPGINGVIQAKDGSRVELAGVYIEGGIFTTEGSGVIRTVNTGTREGASLRGITNRGAFETGLGTTNFLNSTLINDGTFTLRGSSDPSTGSTLTILGTSTLQGTGSMTLEEHSAILRDTSTTSSSSFLINASGHTIQGAGYIGGVPSAVNGGPGLTFTNHEGGVVRANVSGKSLVLSTITASYNAGTMEATGGGILLLTGSGAENRYYNAAPGINGVIQGVIRAKDGSRVELAGVYIEGGIFTTEGSGVIRTVNTGTREGASLQGITNRGAFETGLGTTTNLKNTLTNDGTFHVTAGSTLSTDSGSTYRQMSGITTIDGIVSGSGTMVITGGLLNGTGEIQVGVDLSGILAPGNSIGTLRIGDYTQQQGGVLSIEIGGSTLYDQLLVGNFAALDGRLDIQLAPGFTPGVGDEFRIMTFGSYSGAFDIFQGMDIGGGLYFDPVFSDTAFTLVVRNSGGTASVPEPGTMLLMGSGLAGLLGYGRRWTKK